MQRFLLFLLAAPYSLLAQTMPADPLATSETKALYKNLGKVMKQGFLFGHQDDLAYGVHWKYQEGRSDCKEVTGDYPAVYGWELGRLELDHPVNLDSVPFDRMRSFIIDSYEKGGVITISWHLNNPLTGKTAWDPAPGTVSSILPGGTRHDLYKSWLDKVANFLNSLTTSKGILVPVIFRPFHELNGSWFWWGKNHCTPAEIKALYQFTASYLRHQKQVHHLLYAFNTDRFSSKEEYLERYPGNEWVDVVGFDIYQRNKDTEKFISDISSMLGMLETIATEKNKIPALTEFGFSELPVADWWTGTLSKGLQHHHLAYILAWRNAGSKPGGENEYYIPFNGQVSAPDFLKFYHLPSTLFLKEAASLKLYQ